MTYQAVSRGRQQSRPDSLQRRRLSVRSSKGNLAEFGPALLLFFAFLLVPVLALLRFGVGTTTMYFIVSHAADSAAKAPTYGLALSRVNGILEELISSPIGRISGLEPNAVTRMNLYVQERKTLTGAIDVFGPDEPLRQPISSAVNTYEYEVLSTYAFPPLLPGGSLSWLGKIPLLNAKVELTARAMRAVEYPDGLSIL